MSSKTTTCNCSVFIIMSSISVRWSKWNVFKVKANTLVSIGRRYAMNFAADILNFKPSVKHNIIVFFVFMNCRLL
jgi:hypothetical protein